MRDWHTLAALLMLLLLIAVLPGRCSPVRLTAEEVAAPPSRPGVHAWTPPSLPAD